MSFAVIVQDHTRILGIVPFDIKTKLTRNFTIVNVYGYARFPF